jgi:hypothetical protein
VVNRPGDGSGAGADRGDRASVSAGAATRETSQVAGGGDPRVIQPGALVANDPAGDIAGEPDRTVKGVRLGDRRLAVAGRSALEAGSRHRGDTEGPRLRGTDVLASASPFERGALERAIDRFLEQLGGSDAAALPGLKPISHLLPAAAVVAAALLAMETVRRYSHTAGDDANSDDDGDDADHPGFPGLPDRRRIWALEDR